MAERIRRVYEFRSNGATNAISCKDRSHQFCMINRATQSQIVIPIVSSESRKYIPINSYSNEYIVLNSALVINDSAPYVFAILNSQMHMVWINNFAGKLETRFRYSVGVCWYSFPFPAISNKQKEILSQYVFDIISEREKYPGKTLAWLYDTKTMPAGLKKAHQELDEAIERCYRLQPFTNDTERLEYLFRLYEDMTTRETLFAKPTKRRTKK